MTKLPKGPLKVIHISRKAIAENEERYRSTIGTPRRLMPVVTVWSMRGKKTVKTEGFGVRISGDVSVGYDISRFPPGHQYGTPDVRVWLETNNAVDVADEYGEFNQQEQPAAPPEE